MNLLLDTHAFVWWITDDRRLSARARREIAKERNDVSVSVATAWEIAIKATLGRTEAPLDPFLIENQAEINGFNVIPILLRHAVGIVNLPSVHTDPFDRLIASQARAEGFTIVTSDAQLSQYPVKTLW